MTKKELTLKISDDNNISQAKAAEMIDMVVDSIRQSLENGEEVTLRGFGSWKTVTTAPRSGRNLRTAERITIPSKTRVKFHSYMEEKEV